VWDGAGHPNNIPWAWPSLANSPPSTLDRNCVN
jgi:hypothetical protein